MQDRLKSIKCNNFYKEQINDLLLKKKTLFCPGIFRQHLRYKIITDKHFKPNVPMYILSIALQHF